jgi:hypothetical protein
VGIGIIVVGGIMVIVSRRNTVWSIKNNNP